jgi:hypothetical protein
MIQAAVRYADDSGPAPPELDRYFKWRIWNVLPRAGGSEDQRAGELERMLEAANAYELWRLHKAGGLAKMNANQIKALKELKELVNGRQ